MRIGILSDTHGHTHAAREAIEQLETLGVEYYLHAGDVGDFGRDGTDVLQLFPTGRTAFVFGNNDYDRAGLLDLANILQFQCLGDAGEVVLGGHRIGLTHGDRKPRMDALVRSGVAYLVTGHTHAAHDLTLPGTRWINPGALHRARPKRFAMLDLSTAEVQFFSVDGA